MVGNDFLVPQPDLPVASPIVHPPAQVPTNPVLNDIVYVFERSPKDDGPFKKFINWLHKYSFVAFAFLFLLIIGAAVEVGSIYWTAHVNLAASEQQALKHLPAQPLHGPNTAVYSRQLTKTIGHITAQKLKLDIGGQTTSVDAKTIKSWLKVVDAKGEGVSYIHVNQTAVARSLQQIASPYVKAPVNQVTVTHADGTTYTISAGQTGTTIGDTDKIAAQIADALLGAKGMDLKLPVTTKPFASVTAASFNKLIEVNVITKQMYLYDKGKLTRSYPISAGAPATPTPIGQFKIYEKLTVQDMRGYNTDGTKYFQPHVHWINYFLPGGYAVHGNYWRPLSWFGAINSSHGCVSLPDYQAEWVYDWAPIGTTVITHY
jgi:lipoprotein-anchoring transpeptidase ErfK/SrfK